MPRFPFYLLAILLLAACRNVRQNPVSDAPVAGDSIPGRVWWKEALVYQVYPRRNPDDAPTNAWYLHYFSRQQPDLNWENPQVRQEVYKIMKFWLDKGIDGFRMDAFQFAAKVLNFKSRAATANIAIDLSHAKILLGNYPDPPTNGSLRTYESVIYELPL